MFIVMKPFILSLTLSTLMMLMCMILYKKSNKDREKLSPFECGFDPKSSSRMPFSTQFFLIAVLFLIFDIEIIIIIPMMITIKTSMMINWMMITSMFLLVLILGLYHEWNNGILEWTN